jgi:hypothetical protein
MDIGDDQPVFGENTFSLHYRKINNRDLFTSLENSELGIKSSRNYIPLYETYFNLNETNYNSINLNQRFYVSALSGVVDKNNIQAAVVDAFKSTSESLTIVHKPIFIKFSPLIDPVKYMSGKYENLNLNLNLNLNMNMNSELLNIPTLSKLESQGHLKANDKNNSAYVDGFFSYLSSQVLNCHDFIHGLNFYGSFNAIKSEFYYNVFDDIDYLDKNPFFNKNKTILFDVEDIEYSEDSESNSKCSQTKNTRNKKDKIIIDKTDSINESNETTIHDDFDTINNELNSIFNISPTSSTSSTSAPTSIPSITLLQNNTVSNTEIDCIDNSNNTSNDASLFEAVPLDDIEIAINENDGKIILNKNNDSDYSMTSGSCSSRSSYTSDSGNETGNNDNFNIEESVYDGGSGNSGGGVYMGDKKIKQKYGKNGKNKSKSFSDDSFSGDDNDNDNDDNSCSRSGSDDNSESDDEYDDDDDEYDDDDEVLWATIKNFPVSAIMLEKCDNTLDSLMMQEKEMTENEWTSALMQIIMTLITYQKLFGFTHNDLHTNNVMFVYTEKEYIYYHFNKKYYRVPTYNRAFKIIDFGRAIYKYKSKVICSDSFSITGDAATQYNCEPYFNDNKARLEPNFSFDLCRLGCSIFDYFIDNINDVEKICKKEPLAKIIVEWVTDDQNRNILYKTNGEERYPDFKLYKMIARNVHNHTPHAQLSKPIFAAYEFPKKKVKTTHRIINIDKMPCYME